MASIYTHYKFGKEVLTTLPKNFQDIISGNEDFYYLAQQGPDLFFFNTSFIINKNFIGGKIHSKAFTDFLEKNKELVLNCKNKEMLSYFIGSICHFILDSNIHPTVNSLVSSKFSHMDIETELDRYFMCVDGYEPVSFNTAKLLSYSDKICKSIAPFYKNYKISEKDIKKSIKGFIFYKNLFFNSSNFKENFLIKTMNSLNLKGYTGQVMRRKIPYGVSELNDKLYPIFYKSVDKSSALIENIFDYIFKDEALLSDFNLNYEGELWKN